MAAENLPAFSLLAEEPQLPEEAQASEMPYAEEAETYVQPSRHIGAVAVQQATQGSVGREFEPPPGGRYFYPV